MELTLLDERRRGRYLAQTANYTYHLHSTSTDIVGLRTRLQGIGLTLDVQIDNPFYDIPSGHHSYLAFAPDHVVIAIRGSGEADDWRNNLRCGQQPYKFGGHVHSGFALASCGITQAVQTELRQRPDLYDGKSLWLTGHSSGGSVAILVAQELAAAQIDVAGIYTFGAPKVGDAHYARRYPLRDRLHAFITLGDFVPLLPPHWLMCTGGRFRIQRFKHVI